MRSRLFAVIAMIGVVFLPALCLRADSLMLHSLKLPPGFAITVYTSDVKNARGMALGEKGTLFVGSKGEGRVYAVVDENGDHKADRVYTIAQSLQMPVGVAYRNGALYVSAVSRILRYDNIEQHLSDPPEPVVITDRLPKDTHHGWKYLAFGPEGKLYVAVGVPCNICEVDYERYGHIARMNPDGSAYEVVARGIRNSVGFDWDPSNKELWFTDNGRDWLGDDQPPDELNHAPKDGLHFGYPYCHGNAIGDPEFGKEHACKEFRAPALELGPHVASLGMRFYSGSMFPEEYRGRIFIAEHGSWNRSKKIGYRLTLATTAKDGRWTYSTFAEGWLQGEHAWGRPVDILQMPDGSLLVSDDGAGVIYRITYAKTK
ncbi:MAG TPA: sorbosone dehydrogenase family protein [Nitrospira sp.]|nr:sorbosone dehydrogenase family protein [Nitrospira sp.]